MVTPPLTTRPWILMLALVIAEITSTFESSMAFVALPQIGRHFGDPMLASWTISAFFIVSAGTAALFARLGDLYGRRRLLIVVLLIAGAGSLVSALSTSLPGVIAGRMLQGVTGAVLPLCLGLMRQHLPPKMLPMSIGIMGGVVGVSAGLAFLVAGYLIDHIQWHGMFYFSAGIALIGIVGVYLAVPMSRPGDGERGVDWLGGLYFVPAVSSLMLVLNISRTGWLQWHIGVFLALGLGLLAIWARHELRHPNPLIDLRLFVDKRICLANIVFGLIAVGPMLYPQVILSLAQQPLWTGVGLGLSATLAGLLKQPGTLMGFIAAPIGGRLASRYGSRTAILVGSVFLAAGWLVPLWDMQSFSLLLLTVSLQAFGMVIVYGAVNNQIVEAAPDHRTSEALGLAQVTRSTFTAAGSQVIAALLAYQTISGADPSAGSYPASSAYTLTFCYLLAVCVLAVIAAWMLPRGKVTDQPTTVHQARPVSATRQA